MRPVASRPLERLVSLLVEVCGFILGWSKGIFKVLIPWCSAEHLLLMRGSHWLDGHQLLKTKMQKVNCYFRIASLIESNFIWMGKAHAKEPQQAWFSLKVEADQILFTSSTPLIPTTGFLHTCYKKAKWSKETLVKATRLYLKWLSPYSVTRSCLKKTLLCSLLCTCWRIPPFPSISWDSPFYAALRSSYAQSFSTHPTVIC